MFRFIGFLAGTIMFLVLAVKDVKGYQYYYACAGTALGVITFLIVFRITAQYLNGFWKVWSMRLQKWISNSIFCLNKCISMPQYEGTVHPSATNQRLSMSKVEMAPNFWWGLLEMLISFVLTAIAPILLAVVLFCYGQAIYEECIHKKCRQSYKQKRQEIIARQSARMSLQTPLNESSLGQSYRHSTLKAATFIPTNVDDKIQQQSIQLKLIKKEEQTPNNGEQEQSDTLKSSKQSLPPEQTTFNQSNNQSNPNHQEIESQQKTVRQFNLPRNLLPYSISKITQQSKSYVESVEYEAIEVEGFQKPRQSVVQIDYPIQQDDCGSSRGSVPKYHSSTRMSKQRNRIHSQQNNKL